MSILNGFYAGMTPDRMRTSIQTNLKVSAKSGMVLAALNSKQQPFVEPILLEFGFEKVAEAANGGYTYPNQNNVILYIKKQIPPTERTVPLEKEHVSLYFPGFVEDLTKKKKTSSVARKFG